MRNVCRKLDKLLRKAEEKTARALAESGIKKKARLLAAAEKLGRRALALCEKLSGEEAEIYRARAVSSVTSSLVRQGRGDEAQPLLEKVCVKPYRVDTAEHRACVAYYGSLLCRKGAYNAAGEVLGALVQAPDFSPLEENVHALCMGLGSAAEAFTFSDEGHFGGEFFTKPVDTLLRLRESGALVGQDTEPDCFIRASYYAASERLYASCYEAVSGADLSDAARYAKLCRDVCDAVGEHGFFLPGSMRLLALAAARDCRFADCVKLCAETLEECATYTAGEGESLSGTIQSIAADMYMLLGILHFRASKMEDCVKYFRLALDALSADAHGRALKDVGYVEVELNVTRMTAAEKAAFAKRYLGLAMFALEEQYSVEECTQVIREGAALLEEMRADEPWLGLSVSADCHIIEQMYEKKGETEQAEEYAAFSRSIGVETLEQLRGAADGLEKILQSLRARKRLALRLGMLELFGDYTRFELLLNQVPYREEEDPETLAGLNLDMGEYCRVVGKYEMSLEYDEAVLSLAFDSDGKPRFDVTRVSMWDIASVARAAALVRLGRMPQARRAYREYVEKTRELSGGTLSKKQCVRFAATARDVELNPAACAGYLHTAAQACDADCRTPEEYFTVAELYNHEGIAWYNATPETDMPDDLSGREASGESAERELTERFAQSELTAFETALERVGHSDPEAYHTVELLPSLLSNIGECHARAGRVDDAMDCYWQAVNAFEKLFHRPEFARKDRASRDTFFFPYAVCYKTIGELYDAKGDNKNSAEAFSMAIRVFEQIDTPAARHELAYCLNARGCLRFRLEDYHGEVADITRAIALKQQDDGSEIAMAIMLKNRSDAYRELGNYKGMHADLRQSLDMLDHSGLPDDVLNPFYGSHWFSMGVCQEGRGKIGKAADAYRKAARYMSESQESEGSEAQGFMRALAHFRRAVCLCKREEQEFYGALYEYNNAIDLLEHMPASKEKDENLRQALSSRASLYEVFREIDLAQADYRRAQQLGGAAENES